MFKAKGSYFGPKHLEQTTLSYTHLLKMPKLSQGNTSSKRPKIGKLFSWPKVHQVFTPQQFEVPTIPGFRVVKPHHWQSHWPQPCPGRTKFHLSWWEAYQEIWQPGIHCWLWQSCQNCQWTWKVGHHLGHHCPSYAIHLPMHAHQLWHPHQKPIHSAPCLLAWPSH